MLLKTKLTNQLKAEAEKQNTDIEIILKNISVNGSKRGCSGHVINKSTGSCVYLNTEASVYGPLSDKVMYRLARDNKDYSSNSLKNGNNRWCKPDELASLVIHTLATEKGVERENLRKYLDVTTPAEGRVTGRDFKKRLDALDALTDDSYLY